MPKEEQQKNFAKLEKLRKTLQNLEKQEPGTIRDISIQAVRDEMRKIAYLLEEDDSAFLCN